MLQVTLNGVRRGSADGTTILSACRQSGSEVPALCHDDRLRPCGACRLCVVEVKGWPRPVTACNTPLADGMEIETHAPELERDRRTLLRLLAADYPAEAVVGEPEKEFHRWLRHYQVEAADALSAPGGLGSRSVLVPGQFQDAGHPYLHADFTRCITCHRCVRICEELQGQFVWRTLGRGAATRIVPDGPSLLESSCVSCGACVDACPSGALEDQSVRRHGRPERWTRTTCPYCGTGCEMSVGTRGERIVQVKPVADAPVSKGHLCVKGRYAFDFNDAADRVTQPMIRENGQWRRVPWAEATAYVADRLGRILRAGGPDGIGVLGSARGTNEDNYIAQKFARVVLGTNNVDCCARVCHAPTAAGMKQTLGTGAATNSFDDIEHAAAFLVCGCNPTENHPVVGARIRQAVLRGAKLIVIDPREIELTHHAGVHLRVRPGTNIPLFHALAHVIVTEGLTDASALRERVSGFGEFQKQIAEWPPERAAGITGVPADLIRQAARVYATCKPAMCFHGLGVTEHVQGTDGVVGLVQLALLTGNFGKAGAGVNPLRGQNNVQGSAHMGCEPGLLTGSVPIDPARDRFESVWQAPVPRRPGLNLMEMMDAAAEGELKALWAIGYDVALTNPNTAVTRAALAKLDLVIVQDLFLNELAHSFGHVVLPACSSFEKDGTFMNSERRVQRVRQALAPAGESKPDWEILADVARAMGSGNHFDFHSAEEIWNEIRTVWPAGAGISYARLEHGGLQWPCPSEDHAGTAILHTDTFPHGLRAALRFIAYEPTSETTTREFPFLLTTGRTLFQFNAGTMTMRTPNVRLRPADTLDMAPSDAERLGLHEGDRVRVWSRHGEAILPLKIDGHVKPGELFATFHTVSAFLNQVTSPHRDGRVMTPEFKVVAVQVGKAG